MQKINKQHEQNSNTNPRRNKGRGKEKTFQESLKT